MKRPSRIDSASAALRAARVRCQDTIIQPRSTALAKFRAHCAESLDQLQVTAVDTSLLQKQAADRHASQSASFRINVLGGHAIAVAERLDLVATRQTAGRALRELHDAQGFKRRRSTKQQRQQREANAVELARATLLKPKTLARTATKRNAPLPTTPIGVPGKAFCVTAPEPRIGVSDRLGASATRCPGSGLFP